MSRPSAWQTERRAEAALSDRYLDGAGKFKSPRNNEDDDSDEDEAPGAYAVTMVTETAPPVEDRWDPSEQESNDSLDIQENMDIPRVSCDIPELPSKIPRCSRRCLFLMLAVLISTCAVGGAVAAFLLSKKENSSTTPSADANADADADCQSLLDSFHQCECLGRMDVVDAKVLDQYNLLLTSDELVQFVVGLDTSIESCSPENMALVWLATEMAADEEAGQIIIDGRIQDRLVLADVFETLGGRGWTENTNWMSSASVCDWFGIACDIDGRVVTLSLPENQLQGTLDSRLGLLYDLKSLELSYNEITGSIPLDVWNLPNLENLLLVANQCNGTLPSDINRLSLLESIDVSHNPGIVGPIPSALTLLSNLTYINIGVTMVSGSVSDLIETLPAGIKVLMASSFMDGKIPTSIGRLSNLEILTFPQTYLTGTIPTELGLCTQLQTLLLAFSALTGTLPTELANLSELRSLAVNGNPGITGTIPSEYDKLTKLETYDFSETEIVGTIPLALRK